MRGTTQREVVGPTITPRSFVLERLSRAGRSAGLCCGVALLSSVFLAARPARAQELTSQVLSESGGKVSSGATELTFSQGQAVIGEGVSGSLWGAFGFIDTLSNQFSPVAGNPPFSMVGISSLTVNWFANGNSAGTVYDVQISTSAGFTSIFASSQTQNLSATFTGLGVNTRYYVQVSVQSNPVFTQIGSTYTLAAPPGSPVGLSTFTAPTGSGVTVNWSSGTAGGGFNPAGAVFLAQISTSATFATVWASSQTVNLNAAFTNLDQYVNYYARVQALNGNSIATPYTILSSTFVGLPYILPAIINTVAGGNGSSYSGDGGPARSAGIYPFGVAVDATGNIFIADYSNNRVRKVDPTGIITTIAGNGTAGFLGDDSLAASTSTKLNTPLDVAVDAPRNIIYIADNGNGRIRKIDASGVITTFAGNGSATYYSTDDDGSHLATNVGLSNPWAVDVDADGNVYIADSNHNRIRKVRASDGIITTVAGSGAFGYGGDGGLAVSSTTLLGAPADVAVDAAGNLYIADLTNNRIRKVSASDGIITTVAGNGNTVPGGSGDGGPAVDARFEAPIYRVAVDAPGNIFIPDDTHIRKVDLNGIITTIAGNGNSSGADGVPATGSGLRSTYGVAADEFRGVYFADQNLKSIRQISVATSAPAVPILSVEVRSPISIQWSWNLFGRTAAYKLFTSTEGFLSGALSNRTTYFIEVVLSTNTLYSRELVAINSAGTSTSSIVSAYTLADAPSGIAFGGTSTSTVYLTWNANTNPATTSFEVSYTTTANFAAGSTVSTAPTTTSTFTTVASLAGQTTYYFRVRAYNGDSIATAFTSVAATATAVLQSSVTALSASAGTIGVAFTITGTAFGAPNGDTTRVRFGAGGSTAPITSWSDTQISAVVPLLSSGAYALLIERQGSVFTTTDAGTFTVVVPVISTVNAVGGHLGIDVGGSGFGEFIDGATTKVTLDDTLTLGLVSWSDTVIRCSIPNNVSLATHTVRVVIAPSVGTVQSNAYEFTVTSDMRSLGAGSGVAQWSAMPIWFYQANLRMRAGGGKVTALSRASVDVPPGALTDATSVSIERGVSSGVDSDARDKAQSISALGPMGAPIKFGPEGTRFAVPVTIELPYDLASVPLGRESALGIHYWDRTAGAWTALLTEVDTVQHLLRARTDHFSLYQPLLSGVSPAAVAPAEFRLVDVYPFPNPARRSQTVTIRSQVGLADDVAIRIYDISGRLVHSGSVSSAQIIDDGNGKGSQYTYDYVWDTGGAGSGVYLFAVTAKKAGSSPIQKTGKVGVIK